MPTPLAQFAIRQVRDGRRVGGRQWHRIYCLPAPAESTASRSSGSINGISRQSIWNEQLVEDRRAGPAETAASRLDLTAWLRTLSKRNRQIAKAMSLGETTNDVARQFGLSAGRVSQLRAWLREHWERFQGDKQLVGSAA